MRASMQNAKLYAAGDDLKKSAAVLKKSAFFSHKGSFIDLVAIFLLGAVLDKH